MGVAKTIQLVARSASAANLSFEVGGIVLESRAKLGATVAAFDFVSLYATLGVATEPAKPPLKGHPIVGGGGPFTPYLYNSADLDAELEQNALMRLRAEPIKALLDKGCVARANLYFSRYGFNDFIAATAGQYYSGLQGKENVLANLYQLSASKAEALAQAYGQDGIADPGVAGVVRPSSLTLDFTKGESESGPSVDSSVEGTFYTGNAYKHPFNDATAHSYRAQVNLNDERFAAMLSSLSVPNLEEVLDNELLAANLDVRRFQAAYLSTILFPPNDGTITAIYKHVGEAVAAGETVLRIENNDSINVAGAIVYGGQINIGDSVTINTNLFGDGATTVALQGSVVVARGAGGGADIRWHVIFSCNNLDGSNQHIIPMNYSFADDTTVTFA